MMRYWTGRAHDLGRMSFMDLVKSYFTYPAIAAYLALTVVAFAAMAYTLDGWIAPLVAGVVAFFVYPLAWYFIHRYILHGRYLYKSRWTAQTWKRIHFDHHQDPLDLRVLFGALHTTLPTIALITMPVGWLIGGFPAAMSALAVGLLTTCFYEFVHCVQHLNHLPEWPWLQRMKRLHVAHHFHSEQGNFGITNYFWDQVFGTYYGSSADQPKSPTVFNLGYTAEEAEKHPHVLRMSNGQRRDDGPRGISQEAVRRRAGDPVGENSQQPA